MISDWLRWLGERRDAFLVVSATVYGLGYLVWCFNAWRNDLGQLPALEFQYIIAGILPTVIVGLAFAFFHYFAHMQLAIKAKFGKKTRWFGDILLFFHAILVLFFVYNSLASQYMPDAFSMKILGLWPFYILLTVNILYYIVGNKVLPGILWPAYKFLLSSCLFSIFFIWYIQSYAYLPQVLGGPAPRCAYVDLDISDMSKLSLVSLIPDYVDQTLVSSRVIRSKRLFVYFSGSEYLLIRAATSMDDSKTMRETPLFELRRDFIRTIQWCSDSGPSSADSSGD